MTLKRLIRGGVAAALLASATVPAFAYSIWPDIDFDWYLDVGKPLSATAVDTMPAPRAGYIWAPGRYENTRGGPVWVAGHWIKDDFAADRAAAQHAPSST